MKRHAAVIALVIVGTATRAVAQDDWIGREKIRAGWIYHGDGPDKLAVFKKLSMNSLITHAGHPDRFAQWAREARRTGMHPGSGVRS